MWIGYQTYLLLHYYLLNIFVKLWPIRNLYVSTTILTVVSRSVSLLLWWGWVLSVLEDTTSGQMYTLLYNFYTHYHLHPPPLLLHVYTHTYFDIFIGLQGWEGRKIANTFKLRSNFHQNIILFWSLKSIYRIGHWEFE